MAVTLNWTDEQDEFPIDASCIELLEKLLHTAAETEQIEEGEVSLTFVDNEAIRELNRDYRSKDQATDVLSFPQYEEHDDETEIFYEEEDGPAEELTLLGDIVISVPRALEQAAEYGHSKERELGFLFVHGFLHLLGYDHETAEEEKEMFAKQELILEQAGLRR